VKSLYRTSEVLRCLETALTIAVYEVSLDTTAQNLGTIWEQ